MSLKALFVGIDRYADPSIRELTGASRDAIALHALVTDSLPTVTTTKLIDSDATSSGIRMALDAVLGQADPADTVIVTFSGHGTKSHRLVAYDTTRADLTSTTIGMDEVAAIFKKSHAKAIFCIIDCCFSGAAPGKVLEDTPVARDPSSPLDELAGRGRILLAACNVNEVAYESPTERHGLLTLALMKVLQSGERDTVDLTAAVATVMEQVRTAAGRLGVVQTPVMLGHVEGGLVLPRLAPGSAFHAAFPETIGIKVTSDISDLAAFGLPVAVLNEWRARFRGGLNDLQLAAVNDYRILDGHSTLVVAPTSSGKTFIGEMAATKAIVSGRKAAFLLPYRALVNEKYDLFDNVYGQRLGMRVIRCTGDHTDEVDLFVRGRYDIAVLTYEMFLNLAVRNTALLNQIGLVVLDEAQFITDPMRGIVVELLLTFLLTARHRGVSPQLLTLSAVIGHINVFDEWLGCRNLVTTYRPVPLIEGVLDRMGLYQYVDAAGKEGKMQLLPYGAIVRKRPRNPH